MIPWSSLLSESSLVEVQGLMMTIQPKQRSQDASMFDSTWGSMTTSMQLAEECLRQEVFEVEKDVESVQPLEGLELFAQTIETVLCRIKVRFIDTVIRMEYIPKESKSGVALEIRVKKIDYFDEAGNENTEYSDHTSKRNIYEPVTFSTKKFTLEGVNLYSDEFPQHYRTVIRSASTPKLIDNLQIAPGSPELPPPHSSLHCNQNMIDSSEDIVQDPVLISLLHGQQELRLKLKHNESAVGAKVDLEFNFGPVVMFLSPRQVHILLELARGLTEPDLEDNKSVLKNNYKPMGAADYALVEQELQKQINQPQLMTKGFQHHQGWSSHSLDDSDDEFLPVIGNKFGKENLNDMDSSMSSSSSSVSKPSGYHSSNSSYRRSSLKSKGNVQGLLQDPLTELTQFSAKFSCVYLLILHDDILLPSSTLTNSRTVLPTLASVTKMKNTSEKFFEDLMKILLDGVNIKDFSEMREHLSNICQLNHLRLV
ncbi:autophagy-related protein 2 homolog B-like [Centruroides sculpturatus]|uniref:autophagy-related protein 2 homolog B-like n=1 Tax=Centruroides sculpturatus TaxID=218467 RepID=UPI000C6E8FFE|nr:autophagy-related protein 2 homolog B-like [Centruroides sculpturatus]